MAARTVKSSAEVLAEVEPPAPAAEPTPEQEPEAPAELIEPEIPKAPEPEGVLFQINTVCKITFPDLSEYLALPGFHRIKDPALVEKLHRYATQPGTKRQIWRLEG